jgi:hypothetical protein
MMTGSSVHGIRTGRLILIGLAAAACLVLSVSCGRKGDAGPDQQAGESASEERAGKAAGGRVDFQPLVGRWVRPDGGYVIDIRHIDPDGRADAGYFNPAEIHVARAEASSDEGRLKLFIELQDRGYPGSTYDLVYDEPEDMLVGVYFQALMQQHFNVLFVRMTEQ